MSRFLCTRLRPTNMTFSVFNDDMPSDSGTNKSKSVSRSEKVSLGLQEKVACNNCNDSSSKTKLDKQEIMAVKNTLKSSKISKISTENASDLKVQLTSKTKTVTNKTSEKTSVKESKLASKGLKVLSKDSKEGLKVISKDELKVESKVVSSPPKRNRPDHAFLAFHDNKENWDSEHKEFTTNRQSKKNRIALSIKSDRVPLADITASYRTKLQPRVTSAESTV